MPIGAIRDYGPTTNADVELSRVERRYVAFRNKTLSTLPSYFSSRSSVAFFRAVWHAAERHQTRVVSHYFTCYIANSVYEYAV